MSAPAAPTSFTRRFTGFIDHASVQPSFAAYFDWTRSAGPPSPIEHYVLQNNEPDNVLSDGLGGWIHALDVLTTGDAVTHAVIDSNDLLSPQVPANITNFDGDESMKLKAQNSDGSSSQVTVSNWTSGYATRPAVSGDIAIAAGVDVTSIGTTSATVSWTSSAAETLATHWIVRIYRAALLERELVVPFYITSLPVTGLAPATTYTVTVFARYRATYVSSYLDGGSTTSAPFTTDGEGASAMTGPLSVDVVVGQSFCGTFTSPILDTIEWNVFNGPPGLSITGRASYLYLGDMGGTATAAGIFDATIQATTQAADGADRVPVTLDVRFRVGSPTYSPWFHDDPLRSAIYFDVRALTVKVVCEPVASDSAPRLVLHNSQTFHVILCDGAKIIEDLPTSVVATVMEPDNFDADALLREVWDTDDHETIGGYDLAFFEFTPGTGDDLDEQFEDLNRSDDAQAASREIPGALRLTVEYDGRTLTSLPAAVVIAQD